MLYQYFSVHKYIFIGFRLPPGARQNTSAMLTPAPSVLA